MDNHGLICLLALLLAAFALENCCESLQSPAIRFYKPENELIFGNCFKLDKEALIQQPDFIFHTPRYLTIRLL